MTAPVIYRCIAGRYDPEVASRQPQFWADSIEAALEYGQRERARYLITAEVSMSRPLSIRNDAEALAAAELLGTRWAFPDFYSDVLDTHSAAARLMEHGYDGVILDDASGRIDHLTHVALPNTKVRILEQALVQDPTLASLRP